MSFPGATFLVLATASLALASALNARAANVIVDAGPHERRDTLVSFGWPESLPATSDGGWELRAEDGAARPVQVVDARGWFVEPALPAKATRRYELRKVPGRNGPLPSRLAVVETNRNIELRLDGRTMLRYLAHDGTLPRADIPEIYRRGGYIHPVITPSGRIVTDDYPPNHIHHHGIWAAWTNTRIDGRTPDFWNMGEGKGRVDFLALDGTDAGPVLARIRARQVFTDTLAKPPVRVLEESWQITAQTLGAAAVGHVFDYRSEQRLLTDAALVLPKYFYGGFGFRGPFAWNGPEKMLYLDANGVTNRVAANETRARWFWMGGTVDGALAGMAVLDHPSIFRSPQPLRVHPREPFICWSPSQLGDWEIRPGSTYVSQYRVVAFDGAPDRAQLDRLWNDFAEPPAARVE